MPTALEWTCSAQRNEKTHENPCNEWTFMIHSNANKATIKQSRMNTVGPATPFHNIKIHLQEIGLGGTGFIWLGIKTSGGLLRTWLASHEGYLLHGASSWPSPSWNNCVLCHETSSRFHLCIQPFQPGALLKPFRGQLTLRYSPLILTFNNSVFSLESTCHFQVILRTNSNCKRFSDLHDGHCIHENFEFWHFVGLYDDNNLSVKPAASIFKV
jgi:hypothetical protein